MSIGEDLWLLLGAVVGSLAAFAIPYLISIVTRQPRKTEVAIHSSAPNPTSASDSRKAG